MKINSAQKFRLNIENLTEIDAPILIKSLKSGKLHFDSIEQLSNGNKIITPKNNNYAFSPDYQVIPPHDKVEIIISIECNGEEVISDILEIMVLNSDS
jgi:hypothetical protein